MFTVVYFLVILALLIFRFSMFSIIATKTAETIPQKAERTFFQAEVWEWKKNQCSNRFEKLKIPYFTLIVVRTFCINVMFRTDKFLDYSDIKYVLV